MPTGFRRCLDFLGKNKIIIAVLFLAAAIRVAYLLILHPPLIWADAGIYDGLAWNFVTGHGYSLPTDILFAGREPGYPLFFLAPMYWLFGHSILAIQIFQILLSLGFIAFIYFFARREFSPIVATVTALLLSGHHLFVAYTNEVLTEIPFTILLLISTLIIYHALKRRSVVLCFVGGLLLGATTLIRFVAIFLPIFLTVFIFYYYKNWRDTLKYGSLLVLAMFLMVTPWIFRNYLTFNTFIFGRAGASEIYWSGSYVPWDGEWLGYGTSPLKELSPGSNTASLKIDKILMPLFKDNLKNDPLGVLKVWLKKPVKLFVKSDFKSVLNRDNNLAHSNSFINFNLVANLLKVFNLICLFLWLVNLKLLWKLNRPWVVFSVLVVGYFMLFYLPVNPDSRYKIPLLPFMFIGVGVVTDYFFKKYLKRSRFFNITPKP